MICQAKSRSKHLIGKKHFFLTVLDNPKVNGKTKLLVKCDCGNIHYIPSLKKGYTSCGKCTLVKKKLNHLIFEIGSKYGFVKIINRDPVNKLYHCLCDCGSLINIPHYSLKKPHISCGCYWKNKHLERAKKLEKVKYGYLKVLKFIGMNKDKRANYLVKCKCGKKFERSISYLFGSKSCGCLLKDSCTKGSKNHFAKTNELEVSSMRNLFSTNLYSKKELSEMFGLRYEHVCRIINKSIWKHVE